MGAPARRVIHSNGDTAWEEVLNTHIPLVDFCVADGASVQAVAVGETPHGVGAVFVGLRWRIRYAPWGPCGIGKRGFQGRKWCLKIVLGKADGMRIAKGGTGKLKVRRGVQAIVDTCAAANHGFGIECVGKTEPRGDIVSVHRTAAADGGWKFGGAEKVASAIKQRGSRHDRAYNRAIRVNDVDRIGNAAVAGKIAELNQVVALRIRVTPFVAQAQVEGQLRADFPVVLKEEGCLF